MDKNCLIVLKNKKIDNYAEVDGMLTVFASAGYHFDRISFVAYDQSDEIVISLNEGCERYNNVVVLCPNVMREIVCNFISEKLNARFDDRCVLSGGGKNVFVIFSGGENVLSVSDIVRILDIKYSRRFERSFIKAVGVPDDLLESAISAAKQACPDVDILVHGKYSDVTIEMVYDENISKVAMDDMSRKLLSDLNDYVYALEDISLAERLFQLLKLRRMKICVAESFTGGGISKRLVQVPGVSEVYFEGLNTYANESKMQRLGVEEMTLSQYGAVSAETAYAMASGLLSGGNCNVCVATTGIAGPKSDNTRKPVGLCYISVGTEDGIKVYKYNLDGDRETITETAINLALFLVYKTVK